MTKANIIIGISLIIFSLFAFFYTWSFPEGHIGLDAGTFPRIALMGIILFSIVLVFNNWKVKEKREAALPGFSREILLKLLIQIVCIWIYTILLRPLGFVYASILLMFVVFRLAGTKKWYKAVIYSILLSIAIYFVFYRIFMVMLPRPSLPLPYPF